VFTYVLVIIGWVFFRSETFGMAWHLLGSMTGMNGFENLDLMRHVAGYRLIGLIAVSQLWVWFIPNTWEVKIRDSRALAWGLSILFVICILYLDKESPFLYFQF
ncbi:MAG TPA: hypothetical protein VJ417_03055, partial [Candidatus Glassbacteria bacterium]|nr:hypothetical protein [Candidatus Glassbacteria bacterium]